MEGQTTRVRATMVEPARSPDPRLGGRRGGVGVGGVLLSSCLLGLGRPRLAQKRPFISIMGLAIRTQHQPRTTNPVPTPSSSTLPLRNCATAHDMHERGTCNNCVLPPPAVGHQTLPRMDLGGWRSARIQRIQLMRRQPPVYTSLAL